MLEYATARLIVCDEQDLDAHIKGLKTALKARNRKPESPYMQWCREHREAYSQKYPDTKTTELMKLLGQGWQVYKWVEVIKGATDEAGVIALHQKIHSGDYKISAERVEKLIHKYGGAATEGALEQLKMAIQLDQEQKEETPEDRYRAFITEARALLHKPPIPQDKGYWIRELDELKELAHTFHEKLVAQELLDQVSSTLFESIESSFFTISTRHRRT